MKEHSLSIWTTKSRSDIIICISGQPVTASRPRVQRWGAYYGKKYSAWKEELASLFEPLDFGGADTGPFSVVVLFKILPPKKRSNVYPNGDVDNYLKAVLDAITKAKIVWEDDRQVVKVEAAKVYSDVPETWIVITKDETWAGNITQRVHSAVAATGLQYMTTTHGASSVILDSH